MGNQPGTGLVSISFWCMNNKITHNPLDFKTANYKINGI